MLFRSARLELDPIEAVNVTVRPLKKDEPSPSESDRVLKIELRSERLEADPIDALSITE